MEILDGFNLSSKGHESFAASSGLDSICCHLPPAVGRLNSEVGFKPKIPFGSLGCSSFISFECYQCRQQLWWNFFIGSSKLHNPHFTVVVPGPARESLNACGIQSHLLGAPAHPWQPESELEALRWTLMSSVSRKREQGLAFPIAIVFLELQKGTIVLLTGLCLSAHGLV